MSGGLTPKTTKIGKLFSRNNQAALRLQSRQVVQAVEMDFQALSDKRGGTTVYLDPAFFEVRFGLAHFGRQA